TDLYPLSLHDALPICAALGDLLDHICGRVVETAGVADHNVLRLDAHGFQHVELMEPGIFRYVRPGSVSVVREDRQIGAEMRLARSEEHTSELQSLAYL